MAGDVSGDDGDHRPELFLDREHERSSELEIECLNPPTEHPDALSADEFATGLAMSGFYVHGIVQRFLDWLVMFREPEHARVSAPRRRPGRLGRPESTFPSRLLGSSRGQGVPHHRAGDRCLLLELPAQQHVGRVTRLPTLPRHGQQAHRPLRGRRHSPNRREPHRSGLGQLDLDCPPRSRHLGLRYNQVVEDIPPTIELIDV